MNVLPAAAKMSPIRYAYNVSQGPLQVRRAQRRRLSLGGAWGWVSGSNWSDRSTLLSPSLRYPAKRSRINCNQMK